MESADGSGADSDDDEPPAAAAARKAARGKQQQQRRAASAAIEVRSKLKSLKSAMYEWKGVLPSSGWTTVTAVVLDNITVGVVISGDAIMPGIVCYIIGAIIIQVCLVRCYCCYRCNYVGRWRFWGVVRHSHLSQLPP